MKRGLPENPEEVITNLLKNPDYQEGGKHRNWLIAYARENGVNFDDHYDQSFGNHEIGVERENRYGRN